MRKRECDDINDIVGCNVHGRLSYILELLMLQKKRSKRAIEEVKALLNFFPQED